MTANPIEDVYRAGEQIEKPEVVGFTKNYLRQTVANAAEVRTTDYSNQFGGLYVRETRISYDLDAEDTLTEDDLSPDSDCIRDSEGNAFKRTSSLTAPSPASLGGVFSRDPIPTEFLTGVGVDGTPLAARPDVTDLTGVDPDPTLAANSNDRVASQKAVKTYTASYVAAYVAAQDVEVLKGSIDCSANPNYPAADAGHVYRVSVAGKIGGASGPNVEIGDRLECFVDGTVSSTHAAIGANWIISQVNIDGAMVGPTSSVDGELMLFDSTSGRRAKRAAVTGLLKASAGVLAGPASPGVDYLAPAAIGTTVQGQSQNLSDIAALVDPNADRLLFWDDSAGKYEHLGLGSGLSITGTTLNATAGGGGAGTAPYAHGKLTFVSATALKFSPYNGDQLKIGGVLYSIPAGGIAGLANTGVFVNGTSSSNLGNSTLYYVYAFVNAGVVTADFRTDGNGHLPSDSAGNEGVEVRVSSGTAKDDSRSLIGLVRTTATGQFVSSPAQRFVRSWFNRTSAAFASNFSVLRSSASVAFAEVHSEIRCEFVQWADEVADFRFNSYPYANAIVDAQIGISFDGAAPALGNAVGVRFVTVSQQYGASVQAIGALAEGYHYATVMCANVPGNTISIAPAYGAATFGLSGVVGR